MWIRILDLLDPGSGMEKIGSEILGLVNPGSGIFSTLDPGSCPPCIRDPVWKKSDPG
jgi:hypothetical protein